MYISILYTIYIHTYIYMYIYITYTYIPVSKEAVPSTWAPRNNKDSKTWRSHHSWSRPDLLITKDRKKHRLVIGKICYPLVMTNIAMDDFPSYKSPFISCIFHGYVSHNQMLESSFFQHVVVGSSL